MPFQAPKEHKNLLVIVARPFQGRQNCRDRTSFCPPNLKRKEEVMRPVIFVIGFPCSVRSYF